VCCIIGVPGELYYVREGQVNEYALGFTLPLHTNVTRLFFDWYDDSPDSQPPVKLYKFTRTVFRLSTPCLNKKNVPLLFFE